MSVQTRTPIYFVVRDTATVARLWAVIRPTGEVDCRDDHGRTIVTFASRRTAWSWLCAQAAQHPSWLPPRVERSAP